MKLRAATPADLSWLSARAGCVLTGDARGIAAVDGAGEVRGVVGYDAWTESACCAHMAAAPMAWRALLPAVFEYPFLEAGRGVLLGIIPANNAASCRMALHLGFREAYRVRDGWAVGVDMVIHEMRREECRFIRRTGADRQDRKAA